VLTPDDGAMHLSEYPPITPVSGSAGVREEIRRRRQMLREFAACGYRRDRTITTVNHADGSHRRLDFFVVDRDNPNVLGDITPQMFLPQRCDEG
jgi:hypothetical protein